MSDETDYILDVRHLDDDAAADALSTAEVNSSRRWLGIHFECCGTYTRLYRNRRETAYVGHCPRCGRPVRIRIGPNGHDTRFFRAW